MEPMVRVLSRRLMIGFRRVGTSNFLTCHEGKQGERESVSRGREMRSEGGREIRRLECT